MGSLVVPRRKFLRGLAAAGVFAPAVVRASSLMEISARFSVSTSGAAPRATTHDVLAWLQHEMERRFVETLFGPQNLAAEAEDGPPRFGPFVVDAKITALWELRTRFGLKGAPPKPLDQMPVDVRAGLLSMIEASYKRSNGPALHLTTPCEAGT
jgi:hypothetical protein